MIKLKRFEVFQLFYCSEVWLVQICIALVLVKESSFLHFDCGPENVNLGIPFTILGWKSFAGTEGLKA